MKKIVLRSVKPDLLEKKLTEEQMDELCGGMKCPHCGYDFEPEDFKDSHYVCVGKRLGIICEERFWAFSAYEAEGKAYESGMTEVLGCHRGEYYHTT